MAKLFLVLSIIASGAALFFGFQTKTKVDAVQATVNSARKETADANTKLGKANDELKSTKAQLADANTAKDQAVAEATSAKDAASKAQADLTAAKGQVTDLTNQVEELKKAAIASGTTSSGAPVDVAAQTKQIQDLTAQLAEAKQVAQASQAKAAEAQNRADALTKEKQRRDMVAARGGLEGQVMAVNQGWNFAVISIGDRQGAVPNAQLVVKRGDTMIGRLKISSVEPSTSIADIIPGSMSKGERVLPGDRVIFTGQGAAPAGDQLQPAPQLPQQ